MTTKEFITKAKNVHGDRYDYSVVKYDGAHDKIEILCSVHGSFWQKAGKHLSGQGCYKCHPNTRLTIKGFITKARKVHGVKYDYSNAIYTGSENKIEILCPDHGAFSQKAIAHLSGYGCKTCGKQRLHDANRITEKLFISRCKEVHGNTYNYSMVKYKGCNDKVKIICPIHGYFHQTATLHTNGHGCKKCHLDNIRYTTKDFIKKSRRIHGVKYDYSKVIYKNNCSKVEIICPEHGSFEQTASTHLSGSGCRLCWRSNTDPSCIYVLKNFCGEIRYIGQTKSKLNKRLANHLCSPTSKVMGKWFDSLGRPPIIEKIIDNVSHKDINELEEFLIIEAKDKLELLNVVHNH